MKIKNKYSKRRWNLSMTLKILHIRFLRYLHSIFPDFGLLKDIDYEIGQRNYNFDGINLNLEHIEVFEIVLNEDILGSINNIVRMINRNIPKGYLVAKEPARIRDRLQEILSSSSVNG